MQPFTKLHCCLTVNSHFSPRQNQLIYVDCISASLPKSVVHQRKVAFLHWQKIWNYISFVKGWRVRLRSLRPWQHAFKWSCKTHVWGFCVQNSHVNSELRKFLWPFGTPHTKYAATERVLKVEPGWTLTIQGP